MDWGEVICWSWEETAAVFAKEQTFVKRWHYKQLEHAPLRGSSPILGNRLRISELTMFTAVLNRELIVLVKFAGQSRGMPEV